MRFKQNFSLYPRKSKGKTIWYYRTYDKTGKRTSGTSTGLSSRVKAQAFCEKLFSEGLLLSSDLENKPLKLFIGTFFDDNSPFVQNKLLQNQLTLEEYANSTLRIYRSYYNKHIYPYWRNIQLKNINLQSVKDFRDTVAKKGIKRSSVNTCITVLGIIFTDLVNSGIIQDNPVKKIKPLTADKDKVGAFTIEECKLWINCEYEEEETDFKTIMVVCCLTGLRINEILGLHKDNIYPDHISVCMQRMINGGTKGVKDNQPRLVPIIPELYNYLMQNIKEDGFLSAYSYPKSYTLFRKYCRKLGFEERRIKDNIHIHSGRHFYNTYLLAENISGVKVDAVIGHSDKERTMQRLYTNWNVEHFSDVQEANKKLWNKLMN